MTYLINRSMNAVFDFWLWPVQSLSATWQLLITALPITVFALLVFRFASDQAGIEATKDKIKAYLLELRLYKDDLRVLFRAQGQILRYSLIYMRYALVPLLIMIGPLALVIVQVESIYAFGPLKRGQSTILAATVEDTENLDEIEADLILSEGMAQETPPLRINDSRKILWRIRADSIGLHNAVIRIGEQSVAKQIAVGDTGSRLAPVIYREGDWRTFGSPADKPIDAEAGILSVELPYSRVRAEFVGLSSATWFLMGASLVFGFALRGIFRVTF